jgi:hypothetical protein
MMLTIKTEYLGTQDVGVRVHSKYLENCNAIATFEYLKGSSLSKDVAPFFIDLYDAEKSITVETIGISESTYSEVTGEQVMSYEYYEREADFHTDLIFGAIENQIREQGIDVPWSEKDSLGLSAQKLQKFRQSDHVLHDLSVDELVIK